MPACDSTSSTIPITSAQLTTFGGVIMGTIADGAACMPVIDTGIAPTTCAAPDTCASGGAGHVCSAPFVGLGAPCGATTTCMDLTSPATSPVFGRCVSGTCAALARDGEACTSDTECASAVCGATHLCEGPYDVGHVCTEASQCPGVCNAGTCGRGLNGDACSTGPECKSGTCNAGHCAGAVCFALGL